MNEYVYIGKIVNTHGIKGELRILSDFPYKNKVFIIDNKLIIDNKEYTIKSYRVHKDYDMVTFENYNSINDVLFLKNKKVYFPKDKLILDENEILDEELITYKVLTTNNETGTIEEIFNASPTNKILRIKLDREVLVPISSPMIKEINKKEKTITIELMEGM